MNDKLSVWLAKELEQRGWSHRELSRRAGVSQTAVSQTISEERNVGWDFCAKIAGPLGVTPEEVLQRAGLLTAPGQDDDKLVKQLSDRLKQLNPERRQRVLDFALFEYQEQAKGQEQSKNEKTDRGKSALENTT